MVKYFGTDRYYKALKDLTNLLTDYDFEEVPPMEPTNRFNRLKQTFYLFLLRKCDGKKRRSHRKKANSSYDPTIFLKYHHPKPIYGKFFIFLRKISPIKLKRKPLESLYFVHRNENSRVVSKGGAKIDKEIIAHLCPFNNYRIEYFHNCDGRGYRTYQDFFDKNDLEGIEKHLVEKDPYFRSIYREKRFEGLLN